MLRAILTVAGIIGGGILINEIFGKKPEKPSIGGIPQKLVHKFRMTKHSSKISDANLRRKITRNLNEIIEGYNKFKIGKTSNLKTRPANYGEGYKEMYVLCESSYPYFIDNLEIEYTKKYYEHPKKGNERIGGGEMNYEKDKFYMYVAVK